MGQLAELFYENPGKEFYLRQVARLTKTPKTTASGKLKELVKQGIVIRKKDEPYDKYVAATENMLYKVYKKHFLIEKIYSSGLIQALAESIYPKAIVLFGSVAKGEYDKESDIDLYIMANEKEVNLGKFERALNHRVNLFFEPDFRKLSEELRNNIINGIPLYG
ncbi:TPA: hypothetical protein HA239_04500, partial [Candidatus Woesearchaeota archaeon]|nr:hypothetical protein [Candidatus Woesearchaeota archaeon]